MLDALTVYYDYTCTYSYRAMLWLDRVPGLAVHWRTFSLKEVNRKPDEPSFVEAGSPPSISILALALAHAVRESDFDGYHHAVFNAMHAEERRLSEGELLAIAAEAGFDADGFEAARGEWVARVGSEHREAVTRSGVYGTPTLILNGAGTYFRLGEVPGSETAAREILEHLSGLASSAATLVEMFRPQAAKPTPVSVELPSPKGSS